MTGEPVPIAIGPDDRLAPPRRNGELVFDAPWQGRLFGMCIALLERDGRTWNDFRAFLAAELTEHPDLPYYDAFTAAFERFVASSV